MVRLQNVGTQVTVSGITGGDVMRVLVACEFSGIVREAFRKRGHDAWSCDLLPADDGSFNHYQGDVRTILEHPWMASDYMTGGDWDMMIAHPPCTHLAVSGARYFAEKRADGRQQAAINFFMELAIANIPKICIENPVGIMSRMWRKPDQYIHPYYYGHPISKKTGLWLKGLPKLYHVPEDDMFYKKTDVEPEWVYYGSGGRCSPDHYKNAFSPERSKERSRTYQGIADAMAAQWG